MTNPVKGQRPPKPLASEAYGPGGVNAMFDAIDERVRREGSYQPERREPAEVEMMDPRFTCVYCGESNRCSQQVPGRWTACRGCGRALKKPEPESTRTLDAASYVRASQRARTRAVAEGMIAGCEELERAAGLDEAEAERARSEEGG